MNTPHHTRAQVRIKFPDSYILQGTFGALETIEDIYQYVLDNMRDPQEFELYETPPKRILASPEKDLVSAKMVPRCMIYFKLVGDEETKAEDAPFLNIDELEKFVVEK